MPSVSGSFQAPKEKLPVFETLWLTLNDLYRSIGAMPGLFAATLVISLANRLVTRPFLDRTLLGDSSLENQFWFSIFTMLFTLLNVPAFVAVHRFVITREHFVLRDLCRLKAPIVDYAILMFLLYFANFATTAAMNLADRVDKNNTVAVILVGLSAFALSIFVAFWMIRIILIFPAVAIEAPRANLRLAVRASEGMFWRIVLVSFPPILAFILPSMAFDHFAPGLGLQAMSAPLYALGMALAVFGGAAALSRIYIWRSTGPYGRRRVEPSVGAVENI